MVLLCSGWWFCQCESKRGWIPASYLEPLDGPEEAEDAEPNYEGEQFMEFSSLHACRLSRGVFVTVPCLCRRAARHRQSLQGGAGGRDLSGARGNRRGHSQAAGRLVGRQVRQMTGQEVCLRGT